MLSEFEKDEVVILCELFDDNTPLWDATFFFGLEKGRRVVHSLIGRGFATLHWVESWAPREGKKHPSREKLIGDSLVRAFQELEKDCWWIIEDDDPDLPYYELEITDNGSDYFKHNEDVLSYLQSEEWKQRVADIYSKKNC